MRTRLPQPGFVTATRYGATSRSGPKSASPPAERSMRIFPWSTSSPAMYTVSPAALRRARIGRGQERVVLAAVAVDAKAGIAVRAPALREPEPRRERARPAGAAVGRLVEAHRVLDPFVRAGEEDAVVVRIDRRR